MPPCRESLQVASPGWVVRIFPRRMRTACTGGAALASTPLAKHWLSRGGSGPGDRGRRSHRFIATAPIRTQI